MAGEDCFSTGDVDRSGAGRQFAVFYDFVLDGSPELLLAAAYRLEAGGEALRYDVDAF